MHTSSSGPNVWPGYVAATAGLAMTLLLLIAIMGGHLLTFSRSTSRAIPQGLPPTEHTPTDVIDPAALASIKSVPQASQQSGLLHDVAAAGRRPWTPPGADGTTVAHQPSAEPQVSLEHRALQDADNPANEERDGRIVLTFDAHAHVLDEAVRRSLAEAIDTIPADRQIYIIGMVGESAVARRAGLIRVMAVRNALLDAHVDGRRLRPSLRATRGGPDLTTAERKVIIVPMDSGDSHAP